MQRNFDKFVLSYLVMRIEALLRYLIESREPDYLGRFRESIQPQWEAFSDFLLAVARRILKSEDVDWVRAEAVGLTEMPLYVKRQVYDATLGRSESINDFASYVEVLRNAETIDSGGVFTPDRILVRGGSWSRKPKELHLTALSLAKDLLQSLAKIFNLDDKFEALGEFLAVIQAAIELNKD
jgi:hypothetical protein